MGTGQRIITSIQDSFGLDFVKDDLTFFESVAGLKTFGNCRYSKTPLCVHGNDHQRSFLISDSRARVDYGANAIRRNGNVEPQKPKSLPEKNPVAKQRTCRSPRVAWNDRHATQIEVRLLNGRINDLCGFLG